MNNVLIIEDEGVTARQVKAALEMHHVDADIAEDGRTGLQMFEKKDYDLILLDLRMPQMDGEEVLTRIREQDPFVDVIVYTNYKDFTDIKILTNIGIQGYINKGSRAELNELVDTILKHLAPLDENDVDKMIRCTPKEMLEES